MPAQRQGGGGLGRCDITPEIISWLSERRREFSEQEKEDPSSEGAAQVRQDDGKESDWSGLMGLWSTRGPEG